MTRECSRDHCRREALPDRKMCQGCTDIARKRNKLEGNKLSARKYRLRQYGLTLEDYDRILQGQGGVCYICSGLPKAPYIHLQVDHCHATGKVRGLLCHTCNKALGLLGDSPEILRRAADYLTDNAHQSMSSLLRSVGQDWGFSS